MRITTNRHEAMVAPNLVRWGAVFAGTVMSLGFFALMSSLWLALAYNDADSGGWVSGNLPWFLGGTAVAALFLAGLLAGYLSGVRGAGSGLLNGLTAWGLLFVASLVTVVPGLTAITSNLGAGVGAGTNSIGGVIGQPGAGFSAGDAVWTTFWSLLIGAGVAALGGIIGGAVKRNAEIADTEVRGEHEVREVYPTEPVRGEHEVREVYPTEPVASVNRTEVGRTERVEDVRTERH